MPNTNFQTFHQMGQAINEVVRQATGRDAVQNIDMDHVTVAQNRYYEGIPVSGSIVSFIDREGNLPLEKCIVHIEPVQDLHGYRKPWAGGAGKNKLDITALIPGGSWSENTYAVQTITTRPRVVLSSAPANYKLSYSASSISGTNVRLETYNGDTLVGSHTFTASGASGISMNNITAVQINYGNNGAFSITEPMIYLTTETDTTYEPYSNICPITGWTGANIHVSPTTDAQDGTTYSITFPAGAGTVYGGTLDVTTGLLTVDSRMTVLDGDEAWQISGYNPNVQFVQNSDEFPDIAVAKYENVVCSHLKMINSVPTADLPLGNACFNGQRTAWLISIGFTSLSALKSYLATSPMTVVYPLVTPLTYQLTPTEIRTLLGQNYIWADTGNIEVKYKVLKELY